MKKQSNPGLSDLFNHTEIMTANYFAQHSVCLFTEFPQELCSSPRLNSERHIQGTVHNKVSALSHREKNNQCLHMGIFTVAASYMYRVPVKWGPCAGDGQKGSRGRRRAPPGRAGTLSSLLETEIQCSHSCRSVAQQTLHARPETRRGQSVTWKCREETSDPV